MYGHKRVRNLRVAQRTLRVVRTKVKGRTTEYRAMSRIKRRQRNHVNKEEMES